MSTVDPISIQGDIIIRFGPSFPTIPNFDWTVTDVSTNRTLSYTAAVTNQTGTIKYLRFNNNYGSYVRITLTLPILPQSLVGDNNIFISFKELTELLFQGEETKFAIVIPQNSQVVAATFTDEHPGSLT